MIRKASGDGCGRKPGRELSSRAGCSHPPLIAAGPVSEAFLSDLLQYWGSGTDKAHFCLICAFLVAIKNLPFCPPGIGGWRGGSCFFMVRSSLLHIWNLLLCLFFFRLNCPQCILINSSTPAAPLDKQSNDYWNKNLVCKKFGLWR